MLSRSALLALAGVLLLTLVAAERGVSQPDPRRRHHSVNIVPFVENGQRKYYLSWSSSHAEDWEHDIYAEVVRFDRQGELVLDRSGWRFIGTGGDGAQEPVSVALNPRLGLLLSAWEDGTDLSVGVDVRAQLHYPDGTVVKPNFQVAGGPDAQHSAAAAHCGRYFLVAYADEAPPARYATVMLKVLDDSSGAVIQTLRLTSDHDDNWWPVVASDGRRHALAGWGNGETFSASVLTLDGDSFRASDPRPILGRIDQYFYHVRWVESLRRFLVVGRYGAVSQLCWVDTLGVPSGYGQVPAPVTRETRFAVLPIDEQAWLVAYTTGLNEVALVRASRDSIQLLRRLSPDTHPQLSGVRWVSTGIALEFVSPADRPAFADGQLRLLVAQNDDASDGLVLLVLPLETFSAVQRHRTDPQAVPLLTVWPNPFRDQATVVLHNPVARRVRVSVFDVRGREVAVLWDGPLPPDPAHFRLALAGFPSGLYLVRAACRNFTRVAKVVRIR